MFGVRAFWKMDQKGPRGVLGFVRRMPGFGFGAGFDSDSDCGPPFVLLRIHSGVYVVRGIPSASGSSASGFSTFAQKYGRTFPPKWSASRLSESKTDNMAP